MARKLKPDEAQVFADTPRVPTDVESVLRQLMEKENEPPPLKPASGDGKGSALEPLEPESGLA